jgi:hypothetical protein
MALKAKQQLANRYHTSRVGRLGFGNLRGHPAHNAGERVEIPERVAPNGRTRSIPLEIHTNWSPHGELSSALA